MGVYANNRSIIHQGDNGVHTAAPPDVCKTPSPGGPVPIPYVNVARSGDLAKGTKKVKIEGNPTANAGSELSTSMGDEPGTAGGVVSSKFKGKMTWGSTSTDVKSEGKGVARFMDPTQQNGNSFNTAFTTMGGTGVAYFDDFRGKCKICQRGPHTHQVPENQQFFDSVVTPIISGNNSLFSEDQRRYNNNSTQPPRPPNWAVQPRLARGGKGYMVGVMLCKDNKKIWAVSGAAPHPPLIQFLCRTHGLDLYVNSGPVAPADIIRVNPLMNDPNNPALSAARQQRFNRAWTTAATNAQNGAQGWNAPGNCAAAKLVASGHIPLSLTEFFFAPVNTTWGGGPYNWRVTLLSDRQQANFAARGPNAPWSVRIRNHKLRDYDGLVQFQANADTVASCHTCQHLLYRAMCNVDNRPCANANTTAC